ncbi:MAG: porin family protein [Sphingomonadales bacterium]|nr:porin family protein [Sphingomonadales bacterium]MBD3774878.1 porin family protein [Paracoccaceae bacterium]
MNKTVALIAGASLAVIATPAFAQTANDVPFSGVRVGGEVGYDHLRSGSSEDVDTSRDLKQSIDGVEYGAVVGYDLPVSENVRIGAEASYAGSSASWDNNNGVPNTFNLGRVSASRDIYVGGRIGYVVTPKTMIYAKAGYTNQRFGIQGTDGTTSLSQRLDTDGYRLGAGVEYAVSPNAYIGAEYRYSNYSKGEIDFNGDTPDSSRFNLDTDRHQVVMTAGVRF